MKAAVFYERGDWFCIRPQLLPFSQSLSRVPLFVTPWTDCSMPGFPVLHRLPELAQTRVHCVGNAIQSSHRPLLLPSVFPNIRVFPNELALCIMCQSIGLQLQHLNEY